MEYCDKCGQPLEHVHFMEKVKELLPPNLKLYEMGTGMCAAPIASQDGWLTTHVAYVYDDTRLPYRFAAFRLHPPISSKFKTEWMEEEILRRLPEVAAVFESKSVEIKEGDPLPYNDAIL